MCSIMGYCGRCAAFSDFKDGFDMTVSRGPDDSRITDTGDGLLAFHRLAIMGLTPEGMQPFELDGSYVVCNGEIYVQKRFGLRNTSPHVPGIRHGYVRHAGRGIRAYHL